MSESSSSILRFCGALRFLEDLLIFFSSCLFFACPRSSTLHTSTVTPARRSTSIQIYVRLEFFCEGAQESIHTFWFARSVSPGPLTSTNLQSQFSIFQTTK